jgi:hypothetical protein
MKKNIEIEIPDGHKEVIKTSENGISIEFVKENKEQEMRDFIIGMLNGCAIRLENGRPDAVFYDKDGKTLFELWEDENTKSKYFVCEYNYVWWVFETKFGLKHNEIKSFIKNVVEDTLKINEPTPITVLSGMINLWK